MNAKQQIYNFIRKNTFLIYEADKAHSESSMLRINQEFDDMIGNIRSNKYNGETKLYLYVKTSLGTKLEIEYELDFGGRIIIHPDLKFKKIK